MIQPHNKHMSFSLYISASAVADTIVLLNGNNYFNNKFFSINLTLRNKIIV